MFAISLEEKDCRKAKTPRKIHLFMNKIRIVETEMQSFSADFLNIIERDILRNERSACLVKKISYIEIC